MHLKLSQEMAAILSRPQCINSVRRNPDSKVHGANMGLIWGRQDPCGPQVGPMNFAIWEAAVYCILQ